MASSQRPTGSDEFRGSRTLAEARTSLDEGLGIARDCGYGIYHIDLLLERARLHLLRGEPQPALDDLRVALDEGVHPSPDSGFPTLLAATDLACGYAWGIAEGRHLRAQAFLLQAAQTIGHPEFTPAQFSALAAEVHSLIESARKELEECRKVRKKIWDPKVKDTEAVLERLDKGRLTEYPLQNRTMKIFEWITNGLSAATAAMSTAPPDQWADGRVVAVATSTFLLAALQARRDERGSASRDHIVSSIQEGLDVLQKRVIAGEAGQAAFAAGLRETLERELTEAALRVEACHGRIADLDESIGNILDRLSAVEQFVRSQTPVGHELRALVESSFRYLSLPDQNRLHDILNRSVNQDQLFVIAERTGLDWDNLRGQTKERKALELIRECERSGKLAKLIEELERKRPGLLALPRRLSEFVEAELNPK